MIHSFLVKILLANNDMCLRVCVGYMDLSLLPLFAVCVFLFKAEYLMQCVNESEVLIILKEGTKLRVIPMLQMLLFSGEEEALLSEDETAEDFDFSQL